MSGLGGRDVGCVECSGLAGKVVGIPSRLRERSQAGGATEDRLLTIGSRVRRCELLHTTSALRC